jgi:Xaa-Pro aminopeptidase
MTRERIDRLRALLGDRGLDGLWVSAPVADAAYAANRRYLSGFTGSTGCVLVTADHAAMAVDPRYTQQAALEAGPRGFTVHEQTGPTSQWLLALCDELGLQRRRIGVSQGDITLDGWERLRAAAEERQPGERPDLVPAAGLVEELRRTKDDLERTALERAIEIGDIVCAEVIAAAHSTMTEQDVANAVAEGVRAHGADDISFETIVASGPWGAMPHAHPRDEPIGAGPLVIDMGALVGGYHSDLTRTVPVGREPDARFREVYGIVLETQQTAIERVEPGMKGSDANQIAIDVFERYGFKDHYLHGLGHGVGLAIHEYPMLTRSSEDVIEEGMIFTIEPGLYFADWGGIRIEDIVVMEQGRARILSHAPKLDLAGGHT